MSEVREVAKKVQADAVSPAFELLGCLHLHCFHSRLQVHHARGALFLPVLLCFFLSTIVNFNTVGSLILTTSFPEGKPSSLVQINQQHAWLHHRDKQTNRRLETHGAEENSGLRECVHLG